LQIASFCPYQAIRPASFPPTLLTCSQDDLRVPFWGPLKFAARMRAAQRQHCSQHPHSGQPGGYNSGGPILLLPDAMQGHFVHERDMLHTKAAQYAFLMSALERTLA
jgi:protease II